MSLRWGILSTARIGTEKVIPAMQEAQRTEVVAIASRDGTRADDAAAALSIPGVHDSYESLLRDPTVDAIYNPLPNHLHAEWTMAAARAGKHVLCEKPLGLDSSEAKRMVDVCRSQGVLLMEAFMYRLHPTWVAVRELIEGGRIGELRSVQSWFSYHNDDPENIRNIREFGGGALMDIGCYCINLARMLFDGEPTRVEGSITRDPTDGTDILSSGLLEFEHGVSTFTCSTRAEPDQRVHIHGTAGRIELGIPFNIPPDLPTEVHVTAGGSPPVDPATETLTFPPADQYRIEVELFARSVLDGEALPIPTEDAVANLRVIERVVEAAER